MRQERRQQWAQIGTYSPLFYLKKEGNMTCRLSLYNEQYTAVLYPCTVPISYPHHVISFLSCHKHRKPTILSQLPPKVNYGWDEKLVMIFGWSSIMLKCHLKCDTARRDGERSPPTSQPPPKALQTGRRETNRRGGWTGEIWGRQWGWQTNSHGHWGQPVGRNTV